MIPAGIQWGHRMAVPHGIRFTETGIRDGWYTIAWTDIVWVIRAVMEYILQVHSERLDAAGMGDWAAPDVPNGCSGMLYYRTA